MNVVELHPFGSAGDIAKQLRNVADAIEAGEVTTEAAIFVLFQNDNEDVPPHVYSWGKVPTAFDAIGRLADAQHYLLNMRRRYEQED